MTARLLANENFPAPSVAHLRERGHDVLAIAEVARSLSDVEVLALAVGEQRSVLTFDRDYGELVFSRHLPVPPAIFYLRLPSYRRQSPACSWLVSCSRSVRLPGFLSSSNRLACACARFLIATPRH